MPAVRSAALLFAVAITLLPSAAFAGRGKGSAELVETGVEASASVGYARHKTNASSHSSGWMQEANSGTAPGQSSTASLTFDAISSDSSFVNSSMQPQPCARRKFGSWGVQLSYCTSAPAQPANANNNNGNGPRAQPVLPSPEELAQIATDRAIALAPKPAIEIAPSRLGLTGLDSYFWLNQEPQTIRASASVPGLSVLAEARPVQYVWGFGDGIDKVTSGPGRPWTRRQPGDISHLYETRGRYDVLVEVIWEARWRVSGGGWNNLGYFSNSDSEPYPVRQVVTRLVQVQ